MSAARLAGRGKPCLLRFFASSLLSHPVSSYREERRDGNKEKERTNKQAFASVKRPATRQRRATGGHSGGKERTKEEKQVCRVKKKVEEKKWREEGKRQGRPVRVY